MFPKVLAEGAFWLSLLFIAWMAMYQDFNYKWFRLEMGAPTLKMALQLRRKYAQKSAVPGTARSVSAEVLTVPN